MSTDSTSVSVAHDKVTEIAPTLAPRVSDNPLVLFRLAYNSNGMVPAESLAVRECPTGVIAESSSIDHGCHSISLHQLALNRLAITRGQFSEPGDLILPGILNGLGITFE